MNLLTLAYTFDVIGKVLIGVAVLLVHKGIMKEGKIDNFVVKEIRSEYIVSIIGILFIIMGYILHVFILGK